MKYQIYYDVDYDFGNGDYGTSTYSCYFDGSWFELKEKIEAMKKTDCYNIDAVAIDEL